MCSAIGLTVSTPSWLPMVFFPANLADLGLFRSSLLAALLNQEIEIPASSGRLRGTATVGAP